MTDAFEFRDPRRTFWHYLFYLCWSVLALWAALKMAGVINAPEWLAFGIPASGIVIGVFSLYKNLVDSITDLRLGQAILRNDVGQLNSNMEYLKKNSVLKLEFKVLLKRVEMLETKA